MSKIRRIGLRREPPDGWPLDHVLVGVATLRTLRELIRLEGSPGAAFTHRAWDVALWSGVSPQGSADSLERLCGVGLVKGYLPERAGLARSFRLDREHPLTAPLVGLFHAESVMCRQAGRQAPRG